MLPETLNGVAYFRAPLIGKNESSRKIIHAFTCRSGGALEPLEKLVERVRRAWKLKDIITVKQVHGTEVLLIRGGETDAGDYRKVEADAIITETPDIAVAVRTADCVPILLAAGDKAVAAVHGGWRGIIAGVIENTVMKLRTEMSADLQSMTAAIGPHIGSCCYEVGDDVAEKFKSRFGVGVIKNGVSGKKVLDLALSARTALMEAGLEESNIDILRICTKCNPQWFYSFRRDGKPCGRQLSFIAIEG